MKGVKFAGKQIEPPKKATTVADDDYANDWEPESKPVVKAKPVEKP
jgi:hypothetical protein